MKVLFWTDTLLPCIGGAEILTKYLIPSLEVKGGYHFTIVAEKGKFNTADISQIDGVPVHYFSFQEALFNKKFEEIVTIKREIAKLIKDFKPDLLHINFFGLGLFFYPLTFDTHRTPTIITLHMLPAQHPGNSGVMKKSFLRADWVSAPSAAILDRAREWFPEIIPKSSVVYNSLNMPAVDPKPLPFDAPRLLCLGRLIKDKGVDLALDAFAEITKVIPQARMIIAGDGPAKEGLEKQADRLGLRDRVEFMGWVDPGNVLEVINTSTMVIIPARWYEPFCLVAIQAAHMARPVVAAKMGALPEVIIDQETGILVNNEDSDAIARAALFLIQNPQEAIRLGGNGKARSDRVFGWQRCVDEYDSLYKKIGTER